MFKFIDKKIIISGSMLLCNIWIKLSNQHLCCLLEDNLGQYTNSSQVTDSIPLFVTQIQCVLFQPFRYTGFVEYITFSGYYIFGWVVATGNVITVNVIIVWQWLNNS